MFYFYLPFSLYETLLHRVLSYTYTEYTFLMDFHHPYTPYDIQLQFMQALYACLEDSKIAVFESPTGKLILYYNLLYLLYSIILSNNIMQVLENL
jgi:hypothetical protein